MVFFSVLVSRDSLPIAPSKSGDFFDATVWGGAIPKAGATISIPAGISISLSGLSFGINVAQWDLSGTLVLGQGSDGFTFTNPLNMIVRAGAAINDLTTGHRITLPRKSGIMVLKGATFGAIGTLLRLSGSVGADGSLTLSSIAGPFTVGGFGNGMLKLYNRLTFLVGQSGRFTSPDTFLGGFCPGAQLCADGCDIEVQSGATLSTDDLNGVLNFPVGTISTLLGGGLELGTVGLNTGFQFSSAINLNLFGGLKFTASGGFLRFPGSSNFNLREGGWFSSGISAGIQIFNPLTGANIGNPFLLGTRLAGGSFLLGFALDGTMSSSGSSNYSSISFPLS